MKLETHAHHLFDAIRKGKLRAGFTPPSHEKWKRHALNALHITEKLPLYVLSDPIDDILKREEMTFAQTANTEHRLTSPHDGFIIEGVIRAKDLDGNVGLNTRWIILAYQDDPFIQVLHFFANKAPGSTWFANPYTPQIHPGQVNFQLAVMTTEDADPPKAQHDFADRLESDALTATALAGVIIYLLNAPATVVQSEAIAVPKEVNRGRSLLKKSRIPNHTILTLPRVAYVSPGAGGPIGTHASPATHWRRSHIRHYASGKVVRVPATVVNAKPGQPPPPRPVTEIVLR